MVALMFFACVIVSVAIIADSLVLLGAIGSGAEKDLVRDLDLPPLRCPYSHFRYVYGAMPIWSISRGLHRTLIERTLRDCEVMNERLYVVVFMIAAEKRELLSFDFVLLLDG